MFRKLTLLYIVILAAALSAQVSQQTIKYRLDEKGNIKYRREGLMDGNQVRTLFYNNGEVGQWPYQPSGEWPKGTGHSYLDGVALVISTEITAPGNKQVIHPLETSYREWMDKDPVTGAIWGLEPLPGYSNVKSEKPAINTDPTSWPAVWPAALDLDANWSGYWYGYFGRGVVNSDFETFFVMDDSRDREFTRPPYSYFPVANDSDRAGLGLRVEVRGFQWSHVLAEDIIFWHYDIVNLADNLYPTTLFGFYTDCGVGGTNDSGDDYANYSTKFDLAYCYDADGFGLPDRWKTGYYGYAYLESPGNAVNGFDDDADGITDERRDDGLDNDKDWVGYMDLNGNGKWDAANNEPLNNDVGKDGVGPFDPQYLGPDAGEGDGLPTDGEPNFDKTDKDESDQIGLTAVSIYRLGDGGTGGGWPKDDESMWLKMNYANFDTSVQKANISMVFASGPFPLVVNGRERFSMALVFGNNLDDIVFNKETVQQIYNANYNFSKPPYKPTLTAVAGDNKVYLYWNRVAEESRDPFLGFEQNDPTKGYKKDFEGYLVYRSTDASFNDIKIVTDSKGDAKYWKPIAQFDIIDSLEGPDPVGINGAHFWRGDETGLQHSFVDTDVKNGMRYYYALVSYDMGDPGFGTGGLQPSECTKIITEDFAGNIQFVDINCAVITPSAAVAGYVPPQIEGSITDATGSGSGKLSLEILNPDLIKTGNQYKIAFNSTGTFPKYKTSTYSIIKTSNGVTDTLFSGLDTTYMGNGRYAPPFDGISLTVLNDTTVSIIDTLTGWKKQTTNLAFSTEPDLTSRSVPWPSNYEITFSDSPLDTSYFNAPPFYTQFPVNLKVTNLDSNKQAKLAIKDVDGSKSLTSGDQIQIIEFIGTPSVANSRIAWNVNYGYPVKPGATPIPPAAGDVYHIETTKPFKSGDHFTFTTKSAGVNKELAQSELSQISVVPNPYVATADWERVNLNSTGRGERMIKFINLPQDCTVRIYTVSGALVKTLTKETSLYDGSLGWNLVTEDGVEIAYGLYIYHVDAPGIGEHIGKFAVIK